MQVYHDGDDDGDDDDDDEMNVSMRRRPLSNLCFKKLAITTLSLVNSNDSLQSSFRSGGRGAGRVLWEGSEAGR